MRWLLLLLLLVAPALAHDGPNGDWFKGLRNTNKLPCCDVVDGQRLEDADWRTTDNGEYQVKIKGEWITVPEEAVLNPKNRPIDYAVVWIYQGKITCFLVGSGS